MQSLQSYDDDGMDADGYDGSPGLDDQMAIDDDPSITSSESNKITTIFRTKSLVLATFPWFTTTVMEPSSLTKISRKREEYGYVRPSL